MSINPYDAPGAELADVPSAEPRSAYFLVRCWRGEARLWQAFWLTLVLGYLLLNVATAIVMVALTALMNTTGLIVFAIAVVFNVSFLVFALVSVWRCAPNTDSPPMNAAARVVVVLVLAIIAVQLVGGIVKGMKMIEQRRQQQSQHLESGPVIGSRSSLPSTTRPSMTAFPAR